MKVVVNTCYGGFGLSMKALRKLAELKGHEVYFYITSRYAHEAPPKKKGKKGGSKLVGKNTSEYKQIHDESEKRLGVFAIKNDLGPTCGDEIDKAEWFNDRDLERHDPDLVRVVEELGEAASGEFSELHVTEIPDGVDYEIEGYDGQEWVAERHRTW